MLRLGRLKPGDAFLTAQRAFGVVTRVDVGDHPLHWTHYTLEDGQTLSTCGIGQTVVHVATIKPTHTALLELLDLWRSQC